MNDFILIVFDFLWILFDSVRILLSNCWFFGWELIFSKVGEIGLNSVRFLILCGMLVIIFSVMDLLNECVIRCVSCLLFLIVFMIGLVFFLSVECRFVCCEILAL